MRIEAGIFDVGGVLHANIMPYVHMDITTTLRITEEEFRPLWREISPALGRGEISEDTFWSFFLNRLGKTIKLPEESLFVREYRRRFSINTEIFEIISNLRLKNLKLAILSNSIDSHVQFLTERGILENFSITVFSNEVGISKPNPEIYLLTLERLGIEARKTFFVDDDPDNVQAAIQLGIQGILFENPTQFEEFLKQRGVI